MATFCGACPTDAGGFEVAGCSAEREAIFCGYVLTGDGWLGFYQVNEFLKKDGKPDIFVIKWPLSAILGANTFLRAIGGLVLKAILVLRAIYHFPIGT